MSHTQEKVIGLITARGGSKSILRKNITLVGGKPLIAWTVQAAQQSGCLDRLILSTDDEEIASIAKEWGVEVPFTRPAELAQDDSPHIDVVIHAIQWLSENDGLDPDYILLLQPTSPLRSAEDIVAAIQLVRERNADSVVSVSPVQDHPYFTYKISKDGVLEDFLPRLEGYLRRQVLPPAYALNGAIYVVKRTVLLTQRTFFPEKTIAYIMPEERSMDVDTPWDMKLVDLILSKGQIDARC